MDLIFHIYCYINNTVTNTIIIPVGVVRRIHSTPSDL